MKAYRYNSKSRNDRKFNTCGMEKNPNNLKFYASNLKYAENYKYVYMDCGEVLYECDLEIIEVDVEGLFDMNANFESLDTYKKHIDDVIGVMMRDYTHCLNNATKASDKKLFQGFINGLKDEEENIKRVLISKEFQYLSDFEMQNYLVSELKEKGYKGYKTTNEIVLI